VDKKINLLQLWGIKLEEAAELPQRTIDPITMLVAPFLRASSHLLVTSALSSFLPVFMPLVPATSSETHIRLAVTQLLPGLVDKLNDPKDKIAEPAKDLIVLLGRKAYAADAEFPHTSTVSPKGKDTGGVAAIWETAIKDVLAGRLARGKIGALRLLLTIREDKSCKLPLKPWLPSLVNLLEDSDGGVRDQAREVCINQDALS
jgi:CLIP-associating protein 1/2